MKSVIFLLLISSAFLLIPISKASEYTDKSGNPAPNPCKNGENVYFDTLIFNCVDGKKVYYGCKVNGIEIQQDTIKDENNLRTLYCHKDGDIVKTVVTGCVTDDNQFISETKTVKQVDGTEFSCTKVANGFSMIKKSALTKVSDCAAGETKLIRERYLLECHEESAGYFTFKLAACYANDEKTRVEVSKSHDVYDNEDKQRGLRYSCHAQGSSFYYEAIGCLLGEQYLASGETFKNGSWNVACMRDAQQRLRLLPLHSSGDDEEKTSTDVKTYIKSIFKYLCQPVACVFFKNQKEIPIGSTYNDDKAYQYKCQQSSDNKHLALVKVACLDDENQVLFEGGKKTLSDGSQIECQRDSENGLIRVIVVGKPQLEQCKEGEKFVRDYLQYQCEGQKLKPHACAPFDNDTLIIEIGKTYDSDNYQMKCEEHGKSIIYHAFACFDGDKKVLMPGEKRQIKNFTYECQKKANNEVVLVIYNEKGCKHPTLQDTLVQPNEVIEVSQAIKSVEYKSLNKCVFGGEKGYHLVDFGCKVDDKKYGIGKFVTHQQAVYKCVRHITGGAHLIHVPINQLTCRYGNKVYNNGDEIKSADGISNYRCTFGTIVKTACLVHDKLIPVNQLMHINGEAFYCPGKGDGVIPLPIRGCSHKNGTLIKIGETFNETEITYVCKYIQFENIFKPLIIPIGCVHNGQVIPLNSFILFQNKHIVCEIDDSFTVTVHPATPDQEECIKKTATFNCQSNNNGNEEGGPGDDTGAPEEHHTQQPDEGTTKKNGGEGNENPFPTDEEGNPMTSSDQATTTSQSSHQPHDPHMGTTKSSNGSNDEQGFPTDEQGNSVTKSPDNNATSDAAGGTTKSGDSENGGTNLLLQRKCNTTAVVTSALFADPHFKTFDKFYFDYHGLCPYVFLKPCTSIKGIERFSVKIKNFIWPLVQIEHYQPASIESTNIMFYGQTIYVDKVGNFYVNEIQHEFPYFYPSQRNPKISVEQKIQGTITITTIDCIDIIVRLGVATDKKTNYMDIDVNIPDSLEFFGPDILCGLAGNYDKNSKNDMIFRNGTIVNFDQQTSAKDTQDQINRWGDDWITNNYFAPFSNTSVECTKGVDTNVSSSCATGKEVCKPIKDALNGTGIFAPCKKLENTSINSHYDGCVSDVCADSKLKCPNMESFGFLCQRHLNDTKLSDWRTPLECSKECSANTTYNVCVQNCQPSCTDPQATHCPPSNVPCVEGCQCSVGYVQDQSKQPYQCIKQSDCPPVPTVPDQPGDTTSPPQRKCNATTVVNSGLWGDPHYWTFDGSKFAYHGTCPHVFLQPCTFLDGVENFSIKIKSMRWPSYPANAAMESANLEFYGQKIFVDNNLEFYVNEKKHELPYYYPSQQNPKITAEKINRGTITIKTIDRIDSTIAINPLPTFNFLTLSVNIPDCPEFFGPDKLCGLAGNFDKNCTNDASFKNGTSIHLDQNSTSPCQNDHTSASNQDLINSWGNDWISNDYFIPPTYNISECSKAVNTNVSSDCVTGRETCKSIKDALNGTGIFATCMQMGETAINSHFDGCVSDICVDPKLKCPDFETFFVSCQSHLNGTKLSDWRTSTGCPMQCPVNTTYNICVPNCQPSCTDQLATNCPSSNVPCIEGCQCSVGFVQDQSKQPYHCIKQIDCPPTPTQPVEITGTTKSGGTTDALHTDENGSIVTQSHDHTVSNDVSGGTTSHGVSETGETTSHPQRTCNTTTVVTSGLWDDPHYWTFDGSTHNYQGLCPHVFLQPCTTIKGVEHFSVKIKTLLWIPSPVMSAMESANIEFYGQKIYVDNFANFYVNEMKHEFPYYYPSQKNPKISIERKDQKIITIKTIDRIDLRLELKDRNDEGTMIYLNLQVSIPECPEFFGPNKLCGVAGNYDKNCTNDLLYRNGTKVDMTENSTPCKNDDPLAWAKVNNWADDWITSDYYTPFPSNNTKCIKSTVNTNVSIDCVEGREICKPIKDALNGTGIFGSCKQIGDTAISSHFDGCVSDACTDHNIKCASLETFGLLCQRHLNGTKLSDWRTSAGCPMQCPANTTYNVCVPNCQPSCTDPHATNCPPSIVPCVEGCQCSVGFVQDQSKQPYQCIKQNDCPPFPTIPVENTTSSDGNQPTTDENGNPITKSPDHTDSNGITAVSNGDGEITKPGDSDNVGTTLAPQRKCETTKVVKSRIWGDPHYTTFDGSTHSYQGLCPYVFVQPCSSIKGLENFSVKIKNMKWILQPITAVMESANIELYGQKIYVDHNLEFYVNKAVREFPYFYPSPKNAKISVERKEQNTITIKTIDCIDFTIALVVFNDTIKYMEFDISITDSPEFFGPDKLCGLAGNYDKNCTNDLLYRNGTKVAMMENSTYPCKDDSWAFADLNSWADDWITRDYYSPFLNETSKCIKNDVDNTSISTGCLIGKETCKPIKDALNGTGIFAPCKILEEKAINAHFDGCVFDVCADPNLKCPELETFGLLCQRHLNGTKLSDWRTSSGCPKQCPANTTYNICVPNCQPSCTDQHVTNCPPSIVPCVEGCQCSVGYVQDQSKQPYQCIKQSDCPPVPTVPVEITGTTSSGSTPDALYTDENGNIVTKSPNQTVGNVSDVVSGTTRSQDPENGSTTTPPQRTCNSTKVVTSLVLGDPHYTSFDGSTFDYHGTCPHIFLQPCTSISGYEHFSVKVKNVKYPPNPKLASAESINIELYGQKIYVDNVGKLYVNEIKYRIPYYYPSQQNPKISIETKDGWTITIKTIDKIDFRIGVNAVTYIGQPPPWLSLQVSIPDCPEFFGPDKLCGVIGNYDKNCSNDLLYRNGTNIGLTRNSTYPCRSKISTSNQHLINTLGNDWITNDYFVPPSYNITQCEIAVETNFYSNCINGSEICNHIKDAINGTGIFAPCKQLGDKALISNFDNCVSDVCADSNLKCRSLETFGLLCQRQLNGTKLSDWRTPTECPKQCPANTTYNICVPNCQASCTDSLATNCPPSKLPCVEGCQCSVGYVQDQSKQPFQCIKQIDCPVIPTIPVEITTNSESNPPATDENGNPITKAPEQPGTNGSTVSSDDVDGTTKQGDSETDDTKRKCNSTTVVKSGFWGDPHYTTFDGSAHSYQGLCPYVFLQPCTAIKGVEKFSVKMKNVKWPPSPVTAIMDSANIEFYGQNIYFDKAGNFYVNEKKYEFPYYYPSQQNPKISVETKDGLTVTIKTIDQIDMTLKIMYVDATTTYMDFEVSIPDCPEFFGSDKLCGVAGNYDKNCTNDLMYRNGTILDLKDNSADPCKHHSFPSPPIDSWADDWITSDYYSPFLNDTSKCIKSDVVNTNLSIDCLIGKETCIPIKDSINETGIFAPCKILGEKAINDHFDGCVFDVCADPNLKCTALETFGLLCQRHLNGTKLSDWRTSTECPMQCPANTTYNICVPNCQPSCTDPNSTNCIPSIVPCVEGCQCSVGFVQDQSKQPYRCIKQQDCPPAAPQIKCNTTQVVKSGLWGDPHYTSFDGSKFDYHGTCPHVFLRPCTSISGYANFSIKMKNTKWRSSPIAAIMESANIEFYGHNIYFDKVGKFYVNEVEQEFPYYYPSQRNPKISVETKDGLTVTIKTIDRIDVTLKITLVDATTTYMDLEVSIPDCPEFFGLHKLCGLAGNYDKNVTNNMVYRNGTLVNFDQQIPFQELINAWGNDWITDEYFSPFSNISSECLKGVETNVTFDCANGKELCKPIKDALNGTGVFGPCKLLGEITIISKYEGCVSDVCVDPKLKCADFETFVIACQGHLNGTKLSDWRTSVGCPKQCPENTIYNICVPDCQPSCTDPQATHCSSSNVPCVEGCQCSVGFVQDQSKQPYRCIKQSDCPPAPTIPSEITDATSSSTTPTCIAGGEWSEWSMPKCNDTCGLCGLMEQTRTCLSEASGCPCTGSRTQVGTDRCADALCPPPRAPCCTQYSRRAAVGGTMKCVKLPSTPVPSSSSTIIPTTPACVEGGEWSEWSVAKCNDTCGFCGLIEQTRTCLSEASGCPCTGPTSQVGTDRCGEALCVFPRSSCCTQYSKRAAVGGTIKCVKL